MQLFCGCRRKAHEIEKHCWKHLHAISPSLLRIYFCNFHTIFLGWVAINKYSSPETGFRLQQVDKFVAMATDKPNCFSACLLSVLLFEKHFLLVLLWLYVSILKVMFVIRSLLQSTHFELSSDIEELCLLLWSAWRQSIHGIKKRGNPRHYT